MALPSVVLSSAPSSIIISPIISTESPLLARPSVTSSDVSVISSVLSSDVHLPVIPSLLPTNASSSSSFQSSTTVTAVSSVLPNTTQSSIIPSPPSFDALSSAQPSLLPNVTLPPTQSPITPSVLSTGSPPTQPTPCLSPTLESDQPTISELPLFEPAQNPNFRWGDKDGETFAHSIDLCYKEIVHWRRNLFKVPSGKAGKSFVSELARMFRAFAEGSALECVAMQAAMVMPALLLQKTHPTSKAKDHSKHLERRLHLWHKGDLQELIKEGRTIQLQFTQNHQDQRKSTQQTSRVLPN
jgi:hypothetical protein